MTPPRDYDSTVAEELDRLFDKADSFPGTFNLSALGSYVLSHPEVIQRTETARQIADREHRGRWMTRRTEPKEPKA